MGTTQELAYNRVMKSPKFAVFFLLGAALCGQAHAAFEVFAKGSLSKNHIDTDKYILSLSASTGMAITLLPRVRLEGRYTNTSSLQNVLVIDDVATLNDVMTQTTIYSVGIDLDILGQQSTFQPFIYVGVGYVETKRSYYVTVPSAPAAYYLQEPVRTGISGNLGAGFRISVARALAFEVEAFAYGVDIHKPNPLINLFGSVGIRIFL
jgi:hypothetical protein